MLPTDLPFTRRAWPTRVLAFFLGEALLGFLAIVAGALTLVPMLFQVSPHVDHLLESAQWSIIGWFTVEYGLALAWSPRKRAFLLNPWRALDLLTVVVPLATLLSQVSALLRSSPLLRLIRLVRVVTLGVRATGVVARGEARRTAAAAAGPVELSVLTAGRTSAPSPASWAEFLQWAKASGEEWYHVSSPGPEQLKEIVRAAKLAPPDVESHLYSATYPRLEVTDRHAVLFVWMPEAISLGDCQRNGLLLLANERGLFTLSRQRTGLLTDVAAALSKLKLTGLSFPVRMTCAFFQAVLDRNEEWVGRFEQALRALEEVPVRESRPAFFEQTFRLKKELSTVQSDLWRLKGMLTALAEGRLRLPGGGGDEAGFFGTLAESAEYLYETVVNTREGVLSLIDLHLNVVSFEMNRVMRVLAVVSVLGLIPAVIGGLFGMNLADNPWPFTLPQVGFGVCLGMVLCLYLFLVKGWLR